MDTCAALVGMFPDDKNKWSFAWHVRATCEAGLDAVSDSVMWDSNLLMRFQGEFITDKTIEERVRRKNMIFLVAALDTITGRLVTHTKYMNIDTLLTAGILRRQRRAYNSIPKVGVFFNDPKLRAVSHQDEEV